MATNQTPNGCIPLNTAGIEGNTTLAFALDVAMACSDDAQYRYLTIYGVAWEPLCTVEGIALVTPSNTARTVR